MVKRHLQNADNTNQILNDMRFVSTQLKGRVRSQRGWSVEKVMSYDKVKWRESEEEVYPRYFFDLYTLKIRSKLPSDKLPWPLKKVENEGSNEADTLSDSNPETVITELNFLIEYNLQHPLSVEQSDYEDLLSLETRFHGYSFWSSARTEDIGTREWDSTEFTNFEEGLKGILLSTDNPELYAPIIDCLDSRD